MNREPFLGPNAKPLMIQAIVGLVVLVVFYPIVTSDPAKAFFRANAQWLISLF